MKLEIQEWRSGLISGLEVQNIDEVKPSGDYFDWRPSDIVTRFSTADVSGGVVEGRCKPIEYHQVEYHVDEEIFYFVSGEGVMLFCDLKDGKAVPESYVLLRVRAGMQLSVAKGKAHFVPISTNEGDTIKAVVISPKMDAIIVDMEVPVEA